MPQNNNSRKNSTEMDDEATISLDSKAQTISINLRASNA